MADKKSKVIRVKVTPDMFSRIDREAVAQRRTFTDMVRLLLADGLAFQKRTLVDTTGRYEAPVFGPASGYTPWQKAETEPIITYADILRKWFGPTLTDEQVLTYSELQLAQVIACMRVNEPDTFPLTNQEIAIILRGDRRLATETVTS